MRSQILRSRGVARRRAEVLRPELSRGAAFTLIELLVVMGIIVLLIAILLPALNVARSVTYSTMCQSNLNQLFIGSFAHTQDHEDRLPYFAFMTQQQGFPTATWWPIQLANSMGHLQAEIYKCPADLEPSRQSVYPSSIPRARRHRNIRLYMTYRGSCDLVEPVPKNTAFYQARKITSWKKPYRALMMVEGKKDDPTLPDRECVRWLDDLAGFASPRFKHTFIESWERHLGATNFLFMDGHIEALVPDTYLGDLASTQEFYLP